MSYPTVSVEAARDALKKHKAGDPWTCQPFVRYQGNGEQFDETRAQRTIERFLNIKHDIGLDPLPKNKGKDFEAAAAEVIHQELDLDITTACSKEFWLWLTFAASNRQLIRIVDWRFGTQESIAPVNYGIGRASEIWEGLFARLWWRGQIGYDPTSDDPYRAVRRGDVDIWRSHIIRQEYGRCRNMALALIHYQYPTDDLNQRTLKNVQLRELVKRLRAIDASVAYEILDQASLLNLIRKNAEYVEQEFR